MKKLNFMKQVFCHDFNRKDILYFFIWPNGHCAYIMQEIKFEPNVMCEVIDKKLTFRSSQVCQFASSPK